MLSGWVPACSDIYLLNVCTCSRISYGFTVLDNLRGSPWRGADTHPSRCPRGYSSSPRRTKHCAWLGPTAAREQLRKDGRQTPSSLKAAGLDPWGREPKDSYLGCLLKTEIKIECAKKKRSMRKYPQISFNLNSQLGIDTSPCSCLQSSFSGNV